MPRGFETPHHLLAYPWTTVVLEQFTHQAFSACRGDLNQHVQYKALLVNGTLQPVLLALHGDHDLVQMPFVTTPRGARPDALGNIDKPNFTAQLRTVS